MRTQSRVRMGTFMLSWVAICVAGVGRGDQTTSASVRPRFHVVRQSDSIEILLHGKSIATYVFQHDDVARPFFSHVKTPSGIQVTRHFPPIAGQDPTDHAAMHPGIWIAFAQISGVNFWHNDDGRVLHDGFKQQPTQGDVVRFSTRERFVNSSGVDVCRSVSACQIEKVTAGWLLKMDTSFKSSEPIEFIVKEEMGLGVRVATSIAVTQGSGAIVGGAGGQNEKGTWGRRDRWWDYSGPIDGRTVGIMIMSAPGNPPIWSHSRDYGLLVANPFPVDRPANRDRITVIEPGESFRLRFGLLIHERDQAASLDREAIYQSYVQTLR